MLQVACQLQDRTVTILTYNRSLKDDCQARIKKLHLQQNCQCYTIHGLVSKCSGSPCHNDDALLDILQCWDDPTKPRPKQLFLDLVMIDEAQDLRPSFFKAIKHILLAGNKPHGRKSIQMCVVGDPKQLLYDFDTYGEDRATPQYLMDPKTHWQVRCSIP